MKNSFLSQFDGIVRSYPRFTLPFVQGVEDICRQLSSFFKNIEELAEDKHAELKKLLPENSRSSSMGSGDSTSADSSSERSPERSSKGSKSSKSQSSGGMGVNGGSSASDSSRSYPQ